ncbi:Transcriptional adapter ada2, partial [Phlyctochytrium bullatum]
PSVLTTTASPARLLPAGSPARSAASSSKLALAFPKRRPAPPPPKPQIHTSATPKVTDDAGLPTPTAIAAPPLASLLNLASVAVETPQADTTTPISTRKSKPARSVSRPLDDHDREAQGIVSLNVFNTLLSDPAKLLAADPQDDAADSPPPKPKAKPASAKKKKSVSDALPVAASPTPEPTALHLLPARKSSRRGSLSSLPPLDAPRPKPSHHPSPPSPTPSSDSEGAAAASPTPSPPASPARLPSPPVLLAHLETPISDIRHWLRARLAAGGSREDFPAAWDLLQMGCDDAARDLVESQRLRALERVKARARVEALQARRAGTSMEVVSDAEALELLGLLGGRGVEEEEPQEMETEEDGESPRDRVRRLAILFEELDAEDARRARHRRRGGASRAPAAAAAPTLRKSRSDVGPATAAAAAAAAAALHATLTRAGTEGMLPSIDLMNLEPIRSKLPPPVEVATRRGSGVQSGEEERKGKRGRSASPEVGGGESSGEGTGEGKKKKKKRKAGGSAADAAATTLDELKAAGKAAADVMMLSAAAAAAAAATAATATAATGGMEMEGAPAEAYAAALDAGLMMDGAAAAMALAAVAGMAAAGGDIAVSAEPVAMATVVGKKKSKKGKAREKKVKAAAAALAAEKNGAGSAAAAPAPPTTTTPSKKKKDTSTSNPTPKTRAAPTKGMKPRPDWLGGGRRVKNLQGEFEEVDMHPLFTTCPDDVAPMVWKGTPLVIPPSLPRANELTQQEIQTCSTLRMYPDQYLDLKETLLATIVVRGAYKKRDAQQWFRIDVNKTNKLYDWFVLCGWISAAEREHERRRAAMAEQQHVEKAPEPIVAQVSTATATEEPPLPPSTALPPLKPRKRRSPAPTPTPTTAPAAPAPTT